MHVHTWLFRTRIVQFEGRQKLKERKSETTQQLQCKIVFEWSGNNTVAEISRVRWWIAQKGIFSMFLVAPNVGPSLRIICLVHYDGSRLCILSMRIGIVFNSAIDFGLFDFIRQKKYVFWFWKKVGYWLRKDGELKTDFRWFFGRVGYGVFLYKEIYFYEWSCHLVKKLGTWIIIWNDQHIFQYHCVFMSEEERLFPKTTRHVY